MSQSWSGLRRALEQEWICDSLKGRVQYFLTHYHGAPDQHGRIAVRVDGKEVLHGNPYSYYIKYNRMECDIKDELKIPWRQWTPKGTMYEEENTAVEELIEGIAMEEGIFEIYHFTSAIWAYKNQSITESIDSPNPLVRMLAVMDRRIGKRTLIRLAEEIEVQPKWLQYFYTLRLDAESICKKR